MWSKKWLVLVLVVMVALVSGCGGGAKEGSAGKGADSKSGTSTSAPSASENSASSGTDAGEADAGNPQDAKRKAEPRQVPTEFPLPILDGWVEGVPFGEPTTGSKKGWFAEYHYENDIDDNVKQYDQVLSELGYSVVGHELVEVALGKGYYVIGHISGISYSGVVVFDTNADGQKRVWMEFTEDDKD